MAKGPQPRQDFADVTRKELMLAFLARSDHSANIIRTILFTVSSAGIAFVYQREPPALIHIVTVACFLLAAILVFVSWDIQKRKSLGRFEALRDTGAEAYRGLITTSNFLFDRTAAALILIGVLWEGIVRYCPLLARIP
jgi:hypothetical protein